MSVQPNPSKCFASYLEGKINLQRKGKHDKIEKRQAMPQMPHFHRSCLELRKGSANINEERNPIPYDCQGLLALLYGNHTLDNFVWLGMYHQRGVYL